jgi:hypothetical protein
VVVVMAIAAAPEGATKERMCSAAIGNSLTRVAERVKRRLPQKEKARSGVSGLC